MAPTEDARPSRADHSVPPVVVRIVELRRLEHFLAVVEEGSFTAAAARVFMVQSSLSASLQALERELGTELFVRGRRGAELTDAGRTTVDGALVDLLEAEHELLAGLDEPARSTLAESLRRLLASYADRA